MLDHHIQRTTVYQLAFADSIRFSELKPDDIDSKLFTYHLKKVVSAGLVIKTDSGEYALTPEGRRVGKGALKKQSRMIDRAYSILLLAIQRQEDGAWLLYRRQTHPLLGLTGFMQAQPVADHDVVTTARQECRDKTGLEGEFSVHGHGCFRVYRGEELESFIHFTLLKCTDIQGEVHQSSEAAEYYWDSAPDFAAADMLPNMQILHKMCAAPAGTFAEATFQL
ncbi:MAG: hypothetical protein JWM00_804 [Candidatus Saccharibacteria bacterium]|nr:hypothetical protein [Candidatus Saccharibacteria bacterium]